ncbi:MAG: SDR family oxidoreductase [Thermodesulfobacteriota bacterium]
MKRVVVVTGISGGIGSETAIVFGAADWHVVGVDRRANKAISHIQHFIQADLSRPEAAARIVDEILLKEGRIDALVNNAAVQICKPLIETKLSEWELIMASNVRSIYLLVQAAHPFLKKSHGAIVNVGSVHAFATSKGMAAYAASKGAVLALTRAMALEMAADGIRVNVIIPGAVDTGMLREGLSRDHAVNGDMESNLLRIGRRHPLGRVGQPEEIAKSILFLADNNQSAYITGQSLTVDGGAMAALSTEL